MKKFIPFLFIIFLFASISSYALDFIKLGTSHDESFWGTPDAIFPNFPSTVEYLQERGKNQLTSIELSDQNVQDAFNGDFGPFDAIVVSECRREDELMEVEVKGEEEEEGCDLTPQSYALINQFVSGGGCLILTGDHANGEDEFFNNAFGYNVDVIEVNDVVDTFAIQPGANGTEFAGGPGTLIAADLTSAFSNTPGITIYNGTKGVGVFTDEFGAGTVTAIGWDYCCIPPDEEGPILDWYDVVNRAFDQCAEPEPRAVPTLSEWGLIAMAGVLGIVGFMVMRRKKITV